MKFHYNRVLLLLAMVLGRCYTFCMCVGVCVDVHMRRVIPEGIPRGGQDWLPLAT
jgi:hypothetical protein